VFLSRERDGEVGEGDGRELFPLVWIFKDVKERMRTISLFKIKPSTPAHF